MKVAHWKMAQDWIHHPEPKNSRGVWDDLVKVANAEWRNKERVSLAEKPTYNWEEGNWWDPEDQSVGNTKILEDFEITDEMRRRPNAEGGHIPQLVQPGPGRQGYQGVTGVGKEKRGIDAAGREYGAKPLTKNQVNMMRKNLPEKIKLIPNPDIKGQWLYQFDVYTGKRGSKDYKRVSKALKATPENLDILMTLRDDTMEKMFPHFLTNKKFKELRFDPEHIAKTNKQFAEFLNTETNYRPKPSKGHKWIGKFSVSAINNRQDELGITKEVGSTNVEPRPLSEVKKIIRDNTGGKEFLQVYGGNESTLRKRANQLIANEKWHMSTGRFPTGGNNEGKLWYSFYRASTKGDRIKIVGEFADGNLPRDADGYVDWYKKDKNGVQAWKRVKFVDTEAPKGKQNFKWGNLQADVDNAFGKGFFARNTKGYDLAVMDNQRLFAGKRLSTLVRDKLLMQDLEAKILRDEGRKRKPTKKEIARWKKNMEPGYAMTEAHHTEGVAKNPYKVEPAFRVANRKLKDLEKQYKAGTINKATFIDEINKLPGGIRHKLDDVMVGVKSTEPERVKAAVKAAAFNKNTANQIFKAYQKAGIGTKCQWKGKAEGGRIGFDDGGFNDCMRNAIEENKKQMMSNTPEERAGAVMKNRNAVNAMKKIKGFGNLVRRGVSGLGLDHPVGWLIEAAIEGTFYEYGKRSGETDEQARENLFFPKILEKMVPDVVKDTELWKKYGIKPFKTGVWEGPEGEIEKELSGQNKTVQRYFDNLAALDAAGAEYSQLENAISLSQQGMGYGYDEEGARTNIAEGQARLKELQEEILRLNNLTKEGTPDWQAYQTALEKQQTEQGQRAIEYGEWGQGDTPELAKKRERVRQREMEDKFPDYQKAEMDQMLENWGVYIDPNLSYKGKTVQRPEGLQYMGKPVLNPDAQRGWTYDDFNEYLTYQDKMDYFADNFMLEKKTGGRVSYLDGGIVSLLKKK